MLCHFFFAVKRKADALLKGGSHGQDMRVAVAVLTVNRGDKVLKGAAVKRQSGGPLPLMVLLDGLQDQRFLKKRGGGGGKGKKGLGK